MIRIQQKLRILENRRRRKFLAFYVPKHWENYCFSSYSMTLWWGWDEFWRRSFRTWCGATLGRGDSDCNNFIFDWILVLFLLVHPPPFQFKEKCRRVRLRHWVWVQHCLNFVTETLNLLQFSTTTNTLRILENILFWSLGFVKWPKSDNFDHTNFKTPRLGIF